MVNFEQNTNVGTLQNIFKRGFSSNIFVNLSHTFSERDPSLSGTGGRTYFDNSRLICLVSVHKPVVRDRLKFKNRPVKRSKRASLARFQRDWAILVLLVSYEKKKNVLARLKRDETSEIRRSDGQTMFDRRCLVHNRKRRPLHLV